MSTPDPEETEREAQHVATVPLQWVLDTFADGDEQGWAAEFELLRNEHISCLDFLATSIQETGMQTPILLGNDGRVWDGHHRLCVAHMLGLESVQVVLPARRLPESEMRRDQAEKDAVIAQRRIDVGYAGHPIITAEFPDNGQQIAAAIRAQFTPSPEEPSPYPNPLWDKAAREAVRAPETEQDPTDG